MLLLSLPRSIRAVAFLAWVELLPLLPSPPASMGLLPSPCCHHPPSFSAGDDTGPGTAVSLDAALCSLEGADLRREYKPVGFPVNNLHSLLPWVLLVVVLSAAEMFNFQIDLWFSMTKDAFYKIGQLPLTAECAMPSTTLAVSKDQFWFTTISLKVRGINKNELIFFPRIWATQINS